MTDTPSPLRVLHIGKYFPPFMGGMETYLRDIMAALGRRGVDNQALVHQSTIGWSGSEEAIVVGDQRLRVTRAAVWARILFTPISPLFPWLLARHIRKYQPDILHLHVPNVSAFWALVLPSARRLPWTLHWHSDVPVSEHKWSLRLFYRLYRPLERALLKRAQRVVATSPPYLATSEPLQPFLDKCTVIPLGIDPNYLTLPPTTQLATPSSESLKILAIGRLTYYKGFEYLIRALASIPNANLDLVGLGELDAELRRLARQLGVQHRITFHGRVAAERLPLLLHSCDCLCLPSIERSEAFGLVLLEAMYCGKATIASSVPGSGMNWVVVPKETGELCKPQDAEDLACTLRNLATDRARIARLGQAGRQRFNRLFHIDQSAQALLAEFERVFREHNSGRT